MSNADPKAPPPELVEKARARAVGLNLWPESIAIMASALAAFAHQHGQAEYRRGVEDAAAAVVLCGADTSMSDAFYAGTRRAEIAIRALLFEATYEPAEETKP